jgi:hypothetical protein
MRGACGIVAVPRAEIRIEVSLIAMPDCALVFQGPDWANIRPCQESQIKLTRLWHAERVANHNDRLAVRYPLTANDMTAIGQIESLFVPEWTTDKVMRVLEPDVSDLEPESVQKFYGMYPEATHLPLSMKAHVGETAVLRSDQICSVSGDDAWICEAGRSFQWGWGKLT